MENKFVEALDLYLLLAKKYGDRINFTTITSNLVNKIIGEIDGYQFEIKYKRAIYFTINASSEILDELKEYLFEIVDFNKFPVYDESIINNKVYIKK